MDKGCMVNAASGLAYCTSVSAGEHSLGRQRGKSRCAGVRQPDRETSIRYQCIRQRHVRQQVQRHYIKNLVLILFGVVLIGFVLFLISAFETGGRSRVYAVDARNGKNGYQSDFQAGLMGVVNGVADMQEYSDAVRLSSVAGASDEILAGARAVNKLALHQNMIESGTRRASELGYYALQAVQQSQMPKNEYYTLLQIVEAEATGGDVMSKMMVAGVVLNRMRDSRFPDTIYDVVWQTVGGSAQFQPTQDGRIYSCSVSDTTIEAVDRVLAGEDYSQGALFFFARHSSAKENVQWFDSSLVRLFEYGGHEYYTFQS